MSLIQQYQLLAKKQMGIQEGIEHMKQVQIDLNREIMYANIWGLTAIAANATLIPVNIIVNGVGLKEANSLYQAFVRHLYVESAGSGTRSEDSWAKAILGKIKEFVIKDLSQKGLKNYIPGVSVLFGLAQDTLVLWQTLQTVGSGTREMNLIARDLNLKIAASNREFMRLGIERALIHDRIKEFSKTA